MLAVAVAAAGLWLGNRLQRKSVKKLAKGEMTRLRLHQDLSDSERIQQLSVLLRRISISVFPRTDSASLTGDAWLEFLDRSMSEQSFSCGPGRVLVEAPYRHGCQVDFDALFGLCDEWISGLPEG